MKGTSSDNATITAVGSCSVPLNSEGVGWGILKEQELAGVHKKPMDLQRIPKDTKEVHRLDVSRQPMEEQEIPNQQEHQDTGKVDRLNKGQLEQRWLCRNISAVGGLRVLTHCLSVVYAKAG